MLCAFKRLQRGTKQLKGRVRGGMQGHPPVSDTLGAPAPAFQVTIPEDLAQRTSTEEEKPRSPRGAGPCWQSVPGLPRCAPLGEGGIAHLALGASCARNEAGGLKKPEERGRFKSAP